MGAVTVAAYFLAAIAAALAAARSPTDTRFWSFTTVLLVLLGINKQIDFQSLFTIVARHLAQSEHWYAQRREYQLVFILALLALSAIVAIFIVIRMRRARPPVRIAAVGIVLLLVFIVIRAASFHHVDALLTGRLGRWRLNWIFELGGIALIGIPAGALAMTSRRATRRKR